MAFSTGVSNTNIHYSNIVDVPSPDTQFTMNTMNTVGTDITILAGSQGRNLVLCFDGTTNKFGSKVRVTLRAITLFH